MSPSDRALNEFLSSAGEPLRYEKSLFATSRKVLSTFHTFFPVGVQVAQTVIHFAHFHV